METMTHDARLRLLKFVCSFAWTDLEVTEGERAVVRRLVERYGFGEADRKRIAGWLEVPPPADQVDPLEVPPEHRQLFLDAAREIIEVDGVVQSERDALELFEELMSTAD